jgi:lipopolysaccharide transport system permease protein
MSTAAPLARTSASRFHLRDLIWTLVRTDFKTRYHGTIQGFLWALAKPLMMFLVLMGVFSFIFAAEPAYRLNLIIGLFLWEFFAQGTSVGLTSLRSKGFLISKAKFPSWIIVATSVSNALITLAVFWVIILVTLSISNRPPSPFAAILFLWYVLHLFVFVMGFSLASSVLFLKYNDLNQVWDVILQAGFFIAPIIYPLTILPERFHFYLYLWPPTPVIQFAREVLVDGTLPSARAHLLLTIEAAVVLWIGLAVFRRRAPRAVEYL